MDETPPALPPLSEGAERMYRLLRSWFGISAKKGKEYCWPAQAELARQLGRSIRSVQVYLQELIVADLILCRRTIAGNRYYLLPRAETAPPHAQKLRLRTRRNCASARAETAPPHAQKLRMDREYSEIKKENQQQQQASAAAAASAPLFQGIETEDAVNALLGLDFPTALAREFAGLDPRLAILVATVAAARFREPKQKPIENKIGFICWLFRHPELCGFTRTAGGAWLPPKSGGLAESTRERFARIAREQAARRTPEEQAEFERRKYVGGREEVPT